jgi:hypothetical protein
MRVVAMLYPFPFTEEGTLAQATSARTVDIDRNSVPIGLVLIEEVEKKRSPVVFSLPDIPIVPVFWRRVRKRHFVADVDVNGFLLNPF